MGKLDQGSSKRKLKVLYDSKFYEMEVDVATSWTLLEKLFAKLFKINSKFVTRSRGHRANSNIISNTKSLTDFLKTKEDSDFLEITVSPTEVQKVVPIKKEPVLKNVAPNIKHNSKPDSKNDYLSKESNISSQVTVSHRGPSQVKAFREPPGLTNNRVVKDSIPIKYDSSNGKTDFSEKRNQIKAQSPMETALNFQVLCNKYTEVFEDFPDMTMTREFLVEQILFGVPVNFDVFERGLQRHSITSKLKRDTASNSSTKRSPHSHFISEPKSDFKSNFMKENTNSQESNHPIFSRESNLQTALIKYDNNSITEKSYSTSSHIKEPSRVGLIPEWKDSSENYGTDTKESVSNGFTMSYAYNSSCELGSQSSPGNNSFGIESLTLIEREPVSTESEVPMDD